MKPEDLMSHSRRSRIDDNIVLNKVQTLLSSLLLPKNFKFISYKGIILSVYIGLLNIVSYIKGGTQAKGI